MIKTIICNWGSGDQGKTATIRNVWNELRRLYPSNPFNIFIDYGDLKAIIEVSGFKIGFESQGDPNSRLTDEELADLLGCDIIICACRTRGETPGVINRVASANGYRIFWVTNHRNNDNIQPLNDSLNIISSKNIVDLINEIIAGRL